MRIQNKLIAFITGIVLVVVIFTSYLSLNSHKSMLLHLEQDYFSTLLRVFAYSCKVDIDKFVEVIGDDSRVLYAMVLTPSGEVLVHSQKDMEGKVLTDAETISAIKTNSLRFTDVVWNGKKGIDAAMPILLDDSKINIVRIGFSTEQIERKTLEARDFILLIALSAIFLGISMAYIFSSKIMEPIITLTNTAEQIAKGNRDVSFGEPVIKYPDCMKILNCKQKNCPAANPNKIDGCWHVIGKYSSGTHSSVDYRCDNCEDCPVYKKYMNNEINRLVETFKIMYESIKQKEDALINEENELTKVNKSLQDALKKLVDSEANYKTLTEAARDIIFTLDLRGRFTFINSRAREILGIDTQRQLLNKSFTRILNNESRRTAYEAFKKLQGGDETAAFEVAAYASNGDSKPISLELILSPIIKDGQLAAIHGIARDISYRKSLEAQLIQSGKLSSIGELSAGIAHELNQPLMIIRGYAQFIAGELKSSDKFYKELKFIETQTGRMNKIISHLKTFARESKQHFSLLNINEVIDNSLIMLSEHLKVKNIEMVRKYQEALPQIYGDPNQLEQVFLNLITNARDSMEELGGGVIEFQTLMNEDNNFVTILVSDTGSGIPEENLDKIFNPFFTTKEVGKGTGLGLSISYGIIQAHKGKITVKSKVGEGTVFKIELPAHNAIPKYNVAI